MTCLRYWVGECTSTALRFDWPRSWAATRRPRLLVEPPVVEMIAEDGVLADTKLIRRAVGRGRRLPGGGVPVRPALERVDGRYRDDVRRFWRGEPGLAPPWPTRLCGSADLYHRPAATAAGTSINFITCHDGFHAGRPRELQREAQRDQRRKATATGNENHSWNCGMEGPTDDVAVLVCRRRQARTWRRRCCSAQGTPMLMAGDEFLRSQARQQNACARTTP